MPCRACADSLPPRWVPAPTTQAVSVTERHVVVAGTAGRPYLFTGLPATAHSRFGTARKAAHDRAARLVSWRLFSCVVAILPIPGRTCWLHFALILALRVRYLYPRHRIPIALRQWFRPSSITYRCFPRLFTLPATCRRFSPPGHATTFPCLPPPLSPPSRTTTPLPLRTSVGRHLGRAGRLPLPNNHRGGANSPLPG